MSHFDILEVEYWNWLKSLIPKTAGSHSQLILQLYNIPFTYTMELDGNRLEDGISLRVRYIWLMKGTPRDRNHLKNFKPCSVLEVMIALALRMEEEYMTRYTDEDPVEQWFIPMLESLGLDHCTDWNYDPQLVLRNIQTFLRREYYPNGLGGLFYIPTFPEDMRTVEIWYQMLAWIENYIRGGTN